MAQVVAFEQLYVYVDGSFNPANPERYSGAYAIIDPESNNLMTINSGCGADPDAAAMRNVAGELSAAMRAVQYAQQLANNVVIFYDYSGIANWVTGQWQAKKKCTAAYRDFMNKYKDKIQFVKVRAHTGNKYNELIDKVAKQALAQNKPWRKEHNGHRN